MSIWLFIKILYGGGKFIILGVASVWSTIKSPEDYEMLSQQLAEDELLVMVGVDSSIRMLLNSKIICVPRTQSAGELALWYNISDVVLSLSKGETFGMTIAEAYACGTPVITYNNSAQPELITEGTGFVVESGNISEVYDKIRVIKKKGKTHYSKACRERAMKMYNKAERFQDYINIYNELLNEKSSTC